MKTLTKPTPTLKPNNFKLILVPLFILTTLTACSGDKDDVDILLSDVPSNVINIVQTTLPGISLTEAEKEVKDKVVIYELEGKLINGKEYEIKITQSGTILKIELED